MGLGQRAQTTLLPGAGSATFAHLAKRGVSVALSNSDVPLVRELYKGWHIREIRVRRSINCKTNKRSAIGEVLVTANCRGD